MLALEQNGYKHYSGNNILNENVKDNGFKYISITSFNNTKSKKTETEWMAFIVFEIHWMCFIMYSSPAVKAALS